MKKTLTQYGLIAVAALACWQFGSVAGAQDPVAPTPPQPAPAPVVQHQAHAVSEVPLAANQRPDVFYNHYLNPAFDGTAARMYPAPMPVPARVGQTQYTYQPLLPHEYMYRHDRVYYTPHGTADMFYADPCRCKTGGQPYTRTRVIWGYGSNTISPTPLSLPTFLRKFRPAVGATCR